MTNRKLLRQKLHESYDRHCSLKEYVCFYCNSPADTTDHCPPLSLAEYYPECERILVRCCSLCNSILGDKFLLTLEKRCEYLRNRYLKRWRKDLDMPDWKEDEIDELQGQLKREIIKAMKRKERARIVIRNLEKQMEIFLEKI